MGRNLLVIFIGICCIITLASCTAVPETDSHLSGCYGFPCAWCKSKIEQYYYVYNESGTMYSVYRGGISGTRIGARMEMFYHDEVPEVINKDIKKNGIPGLIMREGMPFCSLRCVNSYEASKGIKEERKRIIKGE